MHSTAFQCQDGNARRTRWLCVDVNEGLEVGRRAAGLSVKSRQINFHRKSSYGVTV